MTSESDAQESITAFWSAVAPHYDEHPGNIVPFGIEEYERWTELFRRALPQAPSDLLDVCTGTGFAAFIAATLGHRVTGIDLASSMLRVARLKAKERGLEVRFIEDDAAALALTQPGYDVVLCRHAMWTLRNAHEAIRRWRNVLRPNGRVVVIDSFHAWSRPDPASEQDQLFYKHYTPDVQAALPFMHVRDKDAVLAAFEGAGYDNVVFDDLPPSFGDGASRPYILIALRGVDPPNAESNL